MTNEMKLQSVQNGMGNISKTEAQKIVRFLNWQNKWDAALQVMFKNYQLETGETDIPYIGFAEFIYNTDKTLPKDYILGISAAN